MPTTSHDDGRLADLERLLDVARQLGATVALDPLLATIAAAATSVLDCERATVFLHDRKAGELYSRLATGIAGSPAIPSVTGNRISSIGEPAMPVASRL